MSLAQRLHALAYTHVSLGNGWAVKIRRPSSEDLRKLGAETLRGVTVGLRAARQAKAEAQAAQQGLSEEEQQAQAQAKAQHELQALADRMDQDLEFQNKIDSLQRAYACAAVVGGAVCPGDWGPAILTDEQAEGLVWETIKLVPTEAQANPNQDVLFVCDALTLAQRTMLYLVIQSREAAPPMVRDFRPEPGDPDADRPDSGEVRGATVHPDDNGRRPIGPERAHVPGGARDLRGGGIIQ